MRRVILADMTPRAVTRTGRPWRCQVAVVLDTAAHPPTDRAELVHEVIARRGVPTQVSLNVATDLVDLRMETWRLGAVDVLRTAGTGLRLRRTERHLRGGVPEVFAVSLALGECVHTACGVTQHYATRACHLNDLTGPTDIAHLGPRGGSLIVHLSCEDLGVSVDTVRAALPRLASSPLLPVVRGHLLALNQDIDRLAADPVVAAPLGLATSELARALVISAAGSGQEQEILSETLRCRVVAYARRHLHDPLLSAPRIAQAHHVSLRSLYNAWGDDGPTLMDWIMQERLAGARRELRATASTGTTIASTARRWGFRDAAHFSRRFRRAYGVAPREWRSDHTHDD